MKALISPKAVVFDMDGVLINSEGIWEDIETAYLMEIAPGYSKANQPDIIGKRLKDLHQFLMDEFDTTVSFEDFDRHFRKMGEDIYRHRTELIPGVRQTLQGIQDRDIAIGLASSSPMVWINMTLQRFEIESFFATVVSGEQVAHGKPAPDIYRTAVENLGQNPQESWAVGDAAVGMQSAKSAGLTVIGFRNGHNDAQSFDDADHVISRLNLLLELI